MNKEVIWYDVLVKIIIIDKIFKINIGIRFAILIKMNFLIIFSIIIFLFFSEDSFSEVYKWTDEKGVIHFSDDFTTIPEKYRSKTEKMGFPIEEGKKEELTGRKKDNDRDRLGRGEEYWRGRVEEWKNKKKLAEERLEELRQKYNELTEKYNESKSLGVRNTLKQQRDQIKIEMDQLKDQLEEAKAMLERKIPEEAELYKAKPEWIK